MNVLARFSTYGNVWFAVVLMGSLGALTGLHASLPDLPQTNGPSGMPAEPLEHGSQTNRTTTNSIGMKLVLIPAGEFLMGSPLSEPERDLKEVPHEVVITRPFYMGTYEVTQREFAQLMGDKPRAEFTSERGGGPEYPMESVLWREAVDFCDRLTELPDEKRAGRQYRLPSEAEWEYACRAGTTAPFYFGESLSSRQANFNGEFPYGDVEKGPYVRKTTKVGSYEPNAFGLYDMHGNVWEWCADWYDANYYRSSPREDPLGPPLGVLPTDFGDFYRVIRGGSWVDDARACRSAYRFRAMPENKYRLIGFRVACDVPENDKSEIRSTKFETNLKSE